MTEKVNPSPFRPAEAFKTAGAIHANSANNNYIIPASSPTPLSVQDTGIDETQFTAFGIQSSGSSLDVTIEPGEAFVFGSWLVIDVDTTITLGSGQTDRTLYVGWDKSSDNEVIIGPDDGRFATSASDSDQKIPLYDVDTDASGVTAVQDLREIGEFAESGGFIGDDTLDAGQRLDIDSDEYMVVGGSYTLNGDAQIDGDLVTVSNQESHDSLADVDPTDHLEVVKEFQVTLDSGTNPAFDGTLTNILDDQFTALDVTVAPTNGLNDTYAFNFDDGRRWNNGSWDLPLTVNWDEDPGSDLDVTVRVHRRT